MVTLIKKIDPNFLLSASTFFILMGMFSLSVGTLKGDDSRITKWNKQTDFRRK